MRRTAGDSQVLESIIYMDRNVPLFDLDLGGVAGQGGWSKSDRVDNTIYLSPGVLWKFVPSRYNDR